MLWCVGYIDVELAADTLVRAAMTHFWPIGEPKARDAAVQKLARLPHAFQGPRTLMGDFNLNPASHLYKIVTDQFSLSRGWHFVKIIKNFFDLY